MPKIVMLTYFVTQTFVSFNSLNTGETSKIANAAEYDALERGKWKGRIRTGDPTRRVGEKPSEEEQDLEGISFHFEL